MPLTRKTTYILVALFIAVGIIMRLVPHPANVTPLTAIALVSGFYFRGKWTILVPVLAMVVSDLFIGWHNLVLFTWGSFAAAVAIGMWLRNQGPTARIVGGALAGSTLFFLVTNWAVWAFGTMYVKDVSGLLRSYEMALPFFRNMLIGDLLFTAIFVFGIETTLVVARRRRGAPEQDV